MQHMQALKYNNSDAAACTRPLMSHGRVRNINSQDESETWLDAEAAVCNIPPAVTVNS